MGVSRPLSSRFMKGDGIPLTPASGPLLPRKDLFAGLLVVGRWPGQVFLVNTGTSAVVLIA
jgi:hypothetical protein